MRKLKRLLKKNSGRNSSGKLTIRHQGGRMRRFLREIDFKRDKDGIWAKVSLIEYDPNRNANIALLIYEDGEKRYILAPDGLKVGAMIISSDSASIEPGNCLPLKRIVAGTQIHNIEVRPGKGGQLVKGAGSSAVIQGKEENWVIVKLPSGEVKRFQPLCRATVGQVGNLAYSSRNIGKAGIKRRMGIKPTVRGTAQNPKSHPHGGGEGRSGVGLKYQKTPWGKPAVGKTRRRRKYSNKLIISGRKKGSHS